MVIGVLLSAQQWDLSSGLLAVGLWVVVAGAESIRRASSGEDCRKVRDVTAQIEQRIDGSFAKAYATVTNLGTSVSTPFRCMVGHETERLACCGSMWQW